MRRPLFDAFHGEQHKIRYALSAKLGVDRPAPVLSPPDKLLIWDSSTVNLCAVVFEWAKYKTIQGALKLHLLLDDEELLRHIVMITVGKTGTAPTKHAGAGRRLLR